MDIETVSKKIVALTFIALIVLGNIWLLSLFTGAPPPAWTASGFIVCLVVLVMGGLGMLAGYFMRSRH